MKTRYRDNTNLVLDIIGVLAIIIGLFSFAIVHNTISRISTIILLLAGIGILITNRTVPIVARYLCSGLIFVSSALITLQAPFNITVIGYFISMMVAGVLLGSLAVWLIGGLASLYYIYVAIFESTNAVSLLNALTILAALLATALLMSIFPPSQQRAAAEAQRRADQLATALGQLQEKQAREQQAGMAISRVISQLSNISNSQSSIVQQQVAALSEVTVTVEQLSRASLQIADDATNVDTSAEHALNAVSTSQLAVNDSMQAMLEIKVQVQEIVGRTLALNERIQSISDVVGAVANIGAQTHLLALNASIEAAGAGSEGERFATVATQVKKLAQQIQGETRRIRDLVVDVQRANAASVLATELGLKDSDRGAARSRVAAEANAEVIETVSSVSIRTRAITMATQQQRSASQQVAETMRQLRTTAQEIASNAVSINQTISELSILAAQLGTLIQAEVGLHTSV